jgi:hypothetical protein
MELEHSIVNRVEASGLITLDLENFYHPGERILFDIKDQLFHGLMLKEKDFRQFVSTFNWQQFQGKNIAFFCSTEAIVPTWAYMLLGIAVEPFANRYVFGDMHVLNQTLFYDAIQKINAADYKDKRVIVKGCSNIQIPVQAYMEITHILLPYVKSIMYGEACSNVPLFKKK